MIGRMILFVTVEYLLIIYWQYVICHLQNLEISQNSASSEHWGTFILENKIVSHFFFSPTILIGEKITAIVLYVHFQSYDLRWNRVIEPPCIPTDKLRSLNFNLHILFNWSVFIKRFERI